MSNTTAPPMSRLVIAGMDPPRLIHIQDSATLRHPLQPDGNIEVEIGGDTAHVALLEDEAVIIVTVRQAEMIALAERIVPLLGPAEGGGR